MPDRIMHVSLINDMAEQPAILRGDNGAAVRFALGTLLVLLLIQVAILITVPAGRHSVGKPISALPPPVSPAPSASLPPALPAALDAKPYPVAPPSAGLPPPPNLLLPRSPGNLPPPPAALSGSLATSRSSTAAPPHARSAPLPVPATSAPLPVSTTGDPEVDTMLAEAKETLALNDPTATRAALEALQRADLRIPEHPIIMREMALAYKKLGEDAVAQALFERSNKAAPRSAPTTAPASASSGKPGSPAPVPPPQSGLDAAFAPSAAEPNSVSGPVKLGLTTVKQDFTCTTGEKHILRLELQAAPGSVISPEDINIDVFFYDIVDGQKAELSKCDKPVWDFELPFDFAQAGVEHVNITYHMPVMNEAEVREHGLRKYHGYVAKLHYKGQFLGATAQPRTLLNNSSAPEANLPHNP